MAEASLKAFRGIEDPMRVVDDIDRSYEDRLAFLQAWQIELDQSEASDAEKGVLRSAINALEVGSVIQDDAPEAAPEKGGYGARDAGADEPE